jgi:hypothetical protein
MKAIRSCPICFGRRGSDRADRGSGLEESDSHRPIFVPFTFVPFVIFVA